MRNRKATIGAIGLWVVAVAATALPAEAALYIVSGRAYGVQESTTATLREAPTSAIPELIEPDLDPVEPTPAGALRHGVRAFLPGVTVEAYEISGGRLLDRTQANRQGYFRLEYDHEIANHDVEFRVFNVFTDGGRELVGESDPVEVGSRIFSFELEVPVEASLRPGTAVFSSVGEFAFVEVGDVDIDNIWDPDADSADPQFTADKVGFTKDIAAFDMPFNGYRLGPDLAFGGTLELYGLFEPASTARYYRLSWAGPGGSTGVIRDALVKKNYVLNAGGVEVLRVRLGPQSVGGEADLYRLDEFMEGQLDTDTGFHYSAFWTELGMRARWNTHGLTPGKYTITVQAFDAAGVEILPAPSHPYASLSLHIDNRAPTANLASIHYLGPPSPVDPPVVLSDAAPCQSVVLNHITPSTDDDSLAFKLTARHPGGLLREWQLDAYHGHNTYNGVIASATPALSFPLAPVGPDDDIFPTPPDPPFMAYQSCAYRFRLRVWPRITNGYHIIYAREDNWYVAIQLKTP